jgi:Xaa-Pro aminopeptidase
VTLGCWGFSVQGVALRVDEVAAFNSFATARDLLLETVVSRAGANGAIGIESSCPHYVTSALGQRIGDRLVVADSEISTLRLIKSAEEIELLTESLHIAEATVRDLYEHLRPGVSRLELMGLARELLLSHGADGVGHITFTLGETNPEIALDEQLSRGRLAALDVGAVVAGYRSDNRRYAYSGTPPAGLVDQHRAMVAIVEAVGQALENGARYADVHNLAVHLFAEAGIPLLPRFSHAGHNIGLETEEQWVDDTSDAVVETGMVINIELYSLTEDDQQIGDEETYVVEASGPRRISRLPTDVVAV